MKQICSMLDLQLSQLNFVKTLIF